MDSSKIRKQGASITALLLLASIAQAGSIRYNDIKNVALDIENAAIESTEAFEGVITEIDLELEDANALWEIDIISKDGQLVTVEIDGQTGEVLSIISNDDAGPLPVNAIDLIEAINIVKSIEHGALVEAELENDDGTLIWEIDSIGTDDEETKFRVNAETGEILI